MSTFGFLEGPIFNIGLESDLILRIDECSLEVQPQNFVVILAVLVCLPNFDRAAMQAGILHLTSG